jgi:hypothetical protein
MHVLTMHCLLCWFLLLLLLLRGCWKWSYPHLTLSLSLSWLQFQSCCVRVALRSLLVCHRHALGSASLGVLYPSPGGPLPL